LLVSPKVKNDSLWINQDAYISVFDSKDLQDVDYKLNAQGNGVYFMLASGEVEIADQNLRNRDALGVWGFFEPLKIQFYENSKLFAIEVPMR